jgi:DNA-binding GntR family transcriptional regulator
VLINHLRRASSAIPLDFARMVPEQSPFSDKEHHALVDAIAHHDEDAAEKMASAHASGAGERLVKVLAERDLVAEE